MQNTWWIGRSCKRREAFRRAVLIGRALAPILPRRKGGAWNGWVSSLRSPCGPQGRPGSGMRARAPCMSATTEAGITRSHSELGSSARLRRQYCSARLREDRASRSCRALPHGRGALAQLGERMAGSHEVRGSIPLGSTTDPRGARRRRRAPLFCFPGRKRRPAGHDCSWALQPAGLLSPAFPGTC